MSRIRGLTIWLERRRPPWVPLLVNPGLQWPDWRVRLAVDMKEMVKHTMLDSQSQEIAHSESLLPSENRNIQAQNSIGSSRKYIRRTEKCEALLLEYQRKLQEAMKAKASVPDEMEMKAIK